MSIRPLFGSEYYGRNKLIKSDLQKEVFTATDKQVYSPQITPKLFEQTTQEVEPYTIPAQDSILQGNIARVKAVTNSIINQRLPTPLNPTHATINKSERKSIHEKAPQETTALIMVLLILGGLLLLAILFFYLMIFIINKAAEDTVSLYGCYIATMVYGSYEHPKVIILRRFRDGFLAKSQWGRNFINYYYRKSPGFVKRFEHSKFSNSYIRVALNIFVFIIHPFHKK